jgi:hypothetical protein
MTTHPCTHTRTHTSTHTSTHVHTRARAHTHARTRGWCACVRTWVSPIKDSAKRAKAATILLDSAAGLCGRGPRAHPPRRETVRACVRVHACVRACMRRRRAGKIHGVGTAARRNPLVKLAETAGIPLLDDAGSDPVSRVRARARSRACEYVALRACIIRSGYPCSTTWIRTRSVGRYSGPGQL